MRDLLGFLFARALIFDLSIIYIIRLYLISEFFSAQTLCCLTKKLIGKKISHPWRAAVFSWDLIDHTVHVSLAPPQPRAAVLLAPEFVLFWNMIYSKGLLQ